MGNLWSPARPDPVRPKFQPGKTETKKSGKRSQSRRVGVAFVSRAIRDPRWRAALDVQLASSTIAAARSDLGTWSPHSTSRSIVESRWLN